MKDKDLVYGAIEFLETQLSREIMTPEWDGAVRTVITAAKDALSSKEQNPFDYEASIDGSVRTAAAWLADRPVSIKDLRAAIDRVLVELSRLREQRRLTETAELEALVTPEPGLSFSFDGGSSAYVDLARANPEVLAELDVVGLRVMAAHLSTALDNVTRALSSKRV